MLNNYVVQYKTMIHCQFSHLSHKAYYNTSTPPKINIFLVKRILLIFLFCFILKYLKPSKQIYKLDEKEL